jgi:tetratricopeptide (TPR) repeat protein
MQSNESGLQTLARVSLQAGQVAKALPPAKRLLREFGNPEALESCCGQLIAQQQVASVREALAIYEEFAEQLLNRPGAVDRLQACISSARNDPQALETLHDLLERAGDTNGGIEMLELAAKGWVAKGELASAADVYRRLAALDPQEPAHRRNFEQLTARLQRQAAPTTQAETAFAAPELTLDSAALAEQSAGGYSDELEAQIQTAIAEAELLDKHQQPKEAIARLEPVAAEAHFDPRLNQLLLGLYRREQRLTDAALCCERLSQVFSLNGQPEQAQGYAQLAAQYRAKTTPQPGHPKEPVLEGRTIEEPISASPTMLPLSAGFDSFRGASADEIDISEEWEQVSRKPLAQPPLAQPPAQATLVQPPKIEASSPKAEQATEQVKEIAEEIRFYLAESLLREAAFAIQRLAEVDPSNPKLPAFREQLAARQAAQSQAESPSPSRGQSRELEIALRPVAEIEEHPPLASTPGGLGEFVGELERSLGADFHLASPAEPPSSALSTPAGTTPVLGDPLSMPAAPPTALGLSVTPSARSEEHPAPVVARKGSPPVPPASATSSTPALDIAEWYRDSKSQAAAPQGVSSPPAPVPQASPLPQIVPMPPVAAPAAAGSSLLDDVFQEFKDEMEAESAKEDPEIHYNLGLAFREMGLLDEAIGEFQKVCQAIDHGQPFAQILQVYTWLAHCLVAKGVPEASFRWYERALRAAPDDEARTAIHYELAEAYEAAGRKQEALSEYMEVYGANIDYREVSQRIKALKS